MSRVPKGRRRHKGKPIARDNQSRSSQAARSSDRTQNTKPRFINIRRVSPGHIVGLFAILALVSFASLSINTLVFSDSGDLSIVYPFDGSLFPPEIITPTIRWEDEDSDANTWHVEMEFASDHPAITADVDTTSWTPDRDLWESIKRNTLDAPATLTVQGFVTFAGLSRTLSSDTISISTSRDPVGSPIFYRDVPLPFAFAVQNPSTIRWRLGDIGSYETPPVVLSNLPVCGNCHSFAADGTIVGMDVDVANDKGAYVLAEFDEETVFTRDKVFSWYDYFGDDRRIPTFGLLARVSPDGRYVVGGMKDRAVFLERPNLAYSQLFFPVQGSLAYYDSNSRQIKTLPGADDDRYVQANGTWTPDGQHITFARSPAPTLATTPSDPVVALSTTEASELLGGPQYIDESRPGYNRFKYDLYTIPFNNGAGGTPVPVRGASQNGKSNYFPAYSPDGKWLVYNQAESFMLLMPDSRLYIVPAEGGEPRLMNCNTASMNSWHSWSPNSKWLVFSSKLFSPYTQLFLTHIDENGVDTPPVLLKNFVIRDRAANIPEFVNIDPDATRVIRERFVDDYNYFRQGQLFEIFGRTADAQDQFLESLRLNPENTDARLALGITYTHRGELGQAETEFKTILELVPQHAHAHFGLANIYAAQGSYSAAIEEYQRSLESGDNGPDFEVSAYLKIGRCRFLLEDNAGALREFETVLAMDPQNSEAHVYLGNIALRRGDTERAISEFENALESDPSMDSLREKIDELRLLGED